LHNLGRGACFFETRGLIFGLAGSGVNFVRPHTCITFAARRLLAVPADMFTDDKQIVEKTLSRAPPWRMCTASIASPVRRTRCTLCVCIVLRHAGISAVSFKAGGMVYVPGSAGSLRGNLVVSSPARRQHAQPSPRYPSVNMLWRSRSTKHGSCRRLSGMHLTSPRICSEGACPT
jgi:hypothetical protein